MLLVKKENTLKKSSGILEKENPLEGGCQLEESPQVLSYERIEPWLSLKVKEFAKLGYPYISEEDLWNLLTRFRWKRTVPEHYYQQIKQIVTLTPNDYLDFASLEAQVYQVQSLDEMNLDGLL